LLESLELLLLKLYLSFKSVICSELLPEFLPGDSRSIVGMSILI
jgi:hypothetical protein